MNWLLDVNLILASRWTTHLDHLAAKAWVDSAASFHTCAISELGFVRISLSGAYGATWNETQESLKKLHARPGYHFLADDLDGTALPETSSKDTTDAHLITLAIRHGLKLATLDAALMGKSWAVGVAENPLILPTSPSS
jgi:predicted nucleic acid-binding protein